MPRVYGSGLVGVGERGGGKSTPLIFPCAIDLTLIDARERRVRLWRSNARLFWGLKTLRMWYELRQTSNVPDTFKFLFAVGEARGIHASKSNKIVYGKNQKISEACVALTWHWLGVACLVLPPRGSFERRLLTGCATQLLCRRVFARGVMLRTCAVIDTGERTLRSSYRCSILEAPTSPALCTGKICKPPFD